VGGQVLGRDIGQVTHNANCKAHFQSMVKLIDGVPCGLPGFNQGLGMAEMGTTEEGQNKGIEFL